MPHHKSTKKRMLTAQKANIRNRAVRSAISTSLKKIMNASKKEEILNEMPKFFSMIDKARKRHQAEFTANKVGNYKRKVHRLLAAAAD